MIVKITDKNNKEIKPIFDENNCITNIKKYTYIYYKCKICGKEARKSSDAFRNSGYPYNPVFDHTHVEFLCKECAIKKTTKKRYGVNNVSQIDTIKKQKKTTMLNNYGNLKQNIIHGKKTIQEKYGVDNISKIDFVKEKKNDKKRKKFLAQKIPEFENLGYTLLEPEVFSKTRDETTKKNIEYQFRCNTCGTVFMHNIHATNPRCHKCYPLNSSLQEKEIVAFLHSIAQEKIEENNRVVISPYEIDIYLPNKHLAIEYNGLYWHSEESGDKDKQYHIHKYNKLKELGITPILVFEDEWLYKQEIVKSILKNKLGIVDNKIYARKCVIQEISNRSVKDFYETNHIQGYVPSSINLALLYNNRIVSALSFGKPRFSKDYTYEITRFANSLNTSVIGGFSKLFKYFTRNYNFEKIVTYSDKRFFIGNIYLQNGFIQLEDTQPSYFYFNKKELIRYNRIKFQKHKLKSLLENFDEQLTEHENMNNNGYLRIWDCGNYKFEFTKKIF